MSYADIKTGEMYAFIIYVDDDVVIFWTDGRESMLARTALDEDISVFSDDGEQIGVTQRFHFVGPEGDIPADVAARRDTIEAYAIANGGQIMTHTDTAPVGRVSLVTRISDLFKV